MTDIRVEIQGVEGCEPCHKLWHKIKPVVQKKGIPVSISIKDPSSAENVFYPVMCVIKEEDGTEISRNCISGYSDNSDKQLLKLLKR